MRRLIPAVLCAALLSLQPATGHAVWQWLRGSALTDFKDSDWEMIRATVTRVLTDSADREQVNWSNPDTGNRGSIMVLASFEFEGRKCRRTALRNLTFLGREDRAVYSLCQQADGDWIFVAESALVDAAAEPASP